MYSLIWSFGSALNETNKQLFQRHLKATFTNTLLMATNTLWEYRLDIDNDYNYQHCIGDSNGGHDDKLYVYTSRTAATNVLLKLLINNNVSVIIDGPSGSGKTSFAHNGISNDERISLLHLLMNEDYTTANMWTQLEESLTWHSGTTYIPMNTELLVAMVDDVHLTQVVQ